MSNIGIMELLVIAGVCGLCLLPVVIGAVAVVVVLVTRNKPNP